MDELGGMEAGAEKFQAEVLRVLKGNLPVLGVIKPTANPFLDAIRSLTEVQLITVTRENRDALVDVLVEKISMEL